MRLSTRKNTNIISQFEFTKKRNEEIKSQRYDDMHDRHDAKKKKQKSKGKKIN